MTADAIMWTCLSRTEHASNVRIPKLDEGPMRAAAQTPVLRDRAGQSGRVRCKWDEVAGWIASLSTAFTQESTDAPVTGAPTDPQKFFKVGADVRAEIEGLGAFANHLAGRAV